MNEISNELGPSNTHTISGENGIGNFTLIYYNLTTEPTTYTSTHTTTVSTTITSTKTDRIMVTSITMDSTTIISTTTVDIAVISTFSSTEQGTQLTYTHNLSQQHIPSSKFNSDN